MIDLPILPRVQDEEVLQDESGKQDGTAEEATDHDNSPKKHLRAPVGLRTRCCNCSTGRYPTIYVSISIEKTFCPDLYTNMLSGFEP